jgi:KUP system potassium uptake protein
MFPLQQADSAAGAAASAPAIKSGFAVLTLGAIGVVYGDIGTSPLYAFRKGLVAAISDEPITQEAVLGVLSLIIWALIIVVTIKYVLILLTADNRGEGGILSLVSLVRGPDGLGSLSVLALGVIGTALFFGDALITPAISVLSAVEGLKLATPAIDPFVLPLTILILIVLFLVQKRGTAKLATYFGPVMLLWFLAIAAIGVSQIISAPSVLFAFNPVHAIGFVLTHSQISLLTLGAVFLAVTGAEAPYADLGHFGKRPIKTAWLFLVFPCLTLNYLGQGALVLSAPETIENPFYRAVPAWGLFPMVGLATAATVIASQAVITGTYSLVRQAIQLGLLPQLEVQHTSADVPGQVYMPQVNLLLLVGVLILVVLFKNSSALATAYGTAVTATMLVTAILAFMLMRKVWRWPLWVVGSLMVPLIAVDAIFLAANMLKVASGGWVPLFIGSMMALVMATWRLNSKPLLARTG